jgi:hypothetical protein
VTPLAIVATIGVSFLLAGMAYASEAGAEDPSMALNGYWSAPPPTISHETDVHPGMPDDVPPNTEAPARLLKLQQPWALEIHKKYLELIEARRALSLEAPSPDNMCLPFAIPTEGSAAYAFPLQFVVTPKLVILLLQLDHQIRIIRINGTHPASLKPSWYGDSVGHWEAGTLVVDTIGFNDRAELQEFPLGWPHTNQMHVIERYRVSPDGTKLEADWTYEDAGALTGPFETGATLVRGEPYQEFVNAENNVEFPCPTAEAGTPYRALSLKNLNVQLEETRKMAAAGFAATKTPR